MVNREYPSASTNSNAATRIARLERSLRRAASGGIFRSYAQVRWCGNDPQPDEPVAPDRAACSKTWWRTTATTASFPEAVRENEEVVPVNVSTWVLPSGVTVGR